MYIGLGPWKHSSPWNWAPLLREGRDPAQRQTHTMKASWSTNPILACLLRLPAIRGFKHNSPGYQLRPLSFRIAIVFASKSENAYKTCVKPHVLGAQMAPRSPPGGSQEASKRHFRYKCLLACSIASTLLLPLRRRNGNVCFSAGK